MSKPKPVYLLAGGNWRQPGSMLPLLQQVVAEAGKPQPRVAYLGTANGDSSAFYWGMSALLKKTGALVERVKLAQAKANVALAKKQLQAADVIFVSGGDVDEGMRWLQQHGLVGFLQELQKSGTLFFGISAGSIMLGTQWVRWRDPKDDATAELFDCLGIAPILCDTHAEGDGWEELKMAVSLRTSKHPGYGIPTGGALRVSAAGRVHALAVPAVRYLRQGPSAMEQEPLPLV
jgi:peptidase E